MALPSISDISMKFSALILAISFEEGRGTKEKLFAVKLSKPASLLITQFTGWVLGWEPPLLHLVFEEKGNFNREEGEDKGSHKAQCTFVPSH